MANNTNSTNPNLLKQIPSLEVPPHWLASGPPYDAAALCLSGIAREFNGCYSTKDRFLLCFVYEGIVFATIYTTSAINALNDAGFHEENFRVPFNPWGLPTLEIISWAASLGLIPQFFNR